MGLSLFLLVVDRSKSRLGFILWVAGLVFLLLGVFITSFHAMVRSQNLRAYHELLVRTADHLGQSGIALIARRVGSDLEPRLRAEVAGLFQANAPATVVVGPALAGQFQEDLNRYFAQLGELHYLDGLTPRTPECTGVEIRFRTIAPLTPVPEIQVARDPVEKEGEVDIVCLVEYHGVVRRAEGTFPFKLVSMVPGPYCRFTLFVPFTPWDHAYNAVGVRFNGVVDTTYQHPIPRRQTFGGPLVLRNSPTPGLPSQSPDDAADLRTRGWVFLGPAPIAGRPRSGPVILKIPNGYDPQTGGQFHFHLPPIRTSAGMNDSPPEIIEDPKEFRTEGWEPYTLGAKLFGYFTHSQFGSLSHMGAAAFEMWPELWPEGVRWSSRWRFLCASTWLFPYGHQAHPSRTLIIGPVLGGLLKAFFARGAGRDGARWGGFFRGPQAQEFYDPRADVSVAPGGRFPEEFINQALFLQPPMPDPLAGYESLKLVAPFSTLPVSGAVRVFPGMAFNRLFDFMNYTTGRDPKKPFPTLEGAPSVSEARYDQDPRCVPFAASMRLGGAGGGIPGLHPSEDVRILLPPTPGVGDDTPEARYFRGNLKDYQVTRDGILRRITHILDLTGLPAADLETGESDRLRDRLFRPSTAADPCGVGWWIPRRTGIFLVQRSKQAVARGVRLSLPGRLHLDRSLIIVVDHGDLVVPASIGAGGAPVSPHLCSLLVLDGDLYLGPAAADVQAYLVALKPGIGVEGGGFGPGGGRLLALSRPHAAPLSITGGLAVWEMGLYPNQDEDPRSCGTTMEHFPNGGIITYNPRFNPSEPSYVESRRVVLADKPISITFRGGGG